MKDSLVHKPNYAVTKPTKQGDHIVDVLCKSKTFLSVQDIYTTLRNNGNDIGLTTVYRHLLRCVEEGSVDTLLTDTGQFLYRACKSSSHHHHLVCRKCKKSIEINSRAVELWTEEIRKQSRYSDITHIITFFGTCPSCKTGTKKK